MAPGGSDGWGEGSSIEGCGEARRARPGPSGRGPGPSRRSCGPRDLRRRLPPRRRRGARPAAGPRVPCVPAGRGRRPPGVFGRARAGRPAQRPGCGPGPRDRRRSSGCAGPRWRRGAHAGQRHQRGGARPREGADGPVRILAARNGGAHPKTLREAADPRRHGPSHENRVRGSVAQHLPEAGLRDLAIVVERHDDLVVVGFPPSHVEPEVAAGAVPAGEEFVLGAEDVAPVLPVEDLEPRVRDRDGSFGIIDDDETRPEVQQGRDVGQVDLAVGWSHHDHRTLLLA